MELEKLYDSLCGNNIKSKYGELSIPDFENEDYEELYFAILEELTPIIGGNYWGWYERMIHSYYRHRAANAKFYEFSRPHLQIPLDNHTIRMQLVILKYAIGRRYWSAYDTEGEKGL